MTPIVKAVRAAEASIVNIRGEKTVNGDSVVVGEGEAGRQVNGMGTGVVIDPRGYIITNHHVVNGVREIQVTLADGRRYIARSVAHDPETDLAIVKIDVPEKLPVLRIGRSSDLMTGETVIAVGNAYGYENTVTQGIISSLHRAVQVSDAQFYSDLIQTDASINPGNSGGPLLNIDGEMIGINVAVRAGAQGIGFAIPIDKAMRVASDLLASRNIRSVHHGLVLGETATREGKGLSVVSIEDDSPAAAAGIRPGDVVTRIGDVDVDGVIDFQRSLLERLPGDELRLALRRDNRALNVDLTLAASTAPPKSNNSPAWDALGMELERIPSGDFRRRFKTSYRGGLSVTAVRPESAAASQGIRPGDVLVGIHVWETISLENVSYILEKSDAATKDSVKFFILRDGATLYGYLSLASASKKTRR
ncbi:MAG: PDZ domain-containing protein [Pirellulaceae bacterium]|nr:PDZ domain-containing protein [Pirellulaceae bacterium]